MNRPFSHVQGECSHLTVSRVLRVLTGHSPHLTTPPSWASENVSPDHCAILSQFLGNTASRFHFSVLSFSPPSSSIPLVLSIPLPSQEPTLPSFFLDHLGESNGSELWFIWGRHAQFPDFSRNRDGGPLCISPRCSYAECHLFLYLNPILRASFCYLSLGICQGQERGWDWGGCEFSLSQIHSGQIYI